MTEQEAKTKWCPMVRHPLFRTMEGDNNLSVNREGYGDTCIASSCALWVTTDSECKSRYPGDPDAVIRKAGHCGLIRG